MSKEVLFFFFGGGGGGYKWVIIGPPAKRIFDGVSLAGR